MVQSYRQGKAHRPGQPHTTIACTTWSNRLGFIAHGGHRSTERFGLEVTSKTTSFQSPSHGQEYLALDLVAPSPMQSGLENSQGWGIHRCSEQSIPASHHPHSIQFFPNIQSTIAPRTCSNRSTPFSSRDPRAKAALWAECPQSRVEGQNPFPWPAAHRALDAARAWLPLHPSLCPKDIPTNGKKNAIPAIDLSFRLI